MFSGPTMEAAQGRDLIVPGRNVRQQAAPAGVLVLTVPHRLCLGVAHTMIAAVMRGSHLAAGLPGDVRGT